MPIKLPPSVSRVINDARSVGQLVEQKALEKLDPARFERQDQAAIAKLSDALRRGDEKTAIDIVANAGPRLAKKIWEADLPKWVEPKEYLSTLQTKPGESWRVKWNYDFNEPNAAKELGRLVPATKGLLGTLTYVKKNFPEGDQRTPGQLTGGTTSAYTPGKPGSGDYTPNTIRMTTSKNERTGEQMPIALMTYSKPPWFDQKSGVGFNDQFKALTPNLILAQGYVSEYSDADLHGDAAKPRGWLSQGLSAAAGGERKGVQPELVRFYMQRTRDDASETPVPPASKRR